MDEAGKVNILTLLHHNNQLNKMKFTNSSIGENTSISNLLIKRNYLQNLCGDYAYNLQFATDCPVCTTLYNMGVQPFVIAGRITFIIWSRAANDSSYIYEMFN